MLLAFASLTSGVPVSPGWLVVAPFRRLKLKAASMPLVGDFSPIDATEKITLSIDFSAQMATGDSVAFMQSAAIDVYIGVDPNAAALIGAYQSTGNVASAWAGPGWRAGVVYRVTMTVQTALGAVETGYAHIFCAPKN